MTETGFIAERWYTDQELQARGIGPDTQRVGRESGALKFSNLNGSFTYLGADLIAWFEANAGRGGRASIRAAKSSVTIIRPNATADFSATKGTPAMSTKREVQAAQQVARQQAIDRYFAAVEAERERSGCDKQTANARVARQQPELHQAFLIATNVRSGAFV